MSTQSGFPATIVLTKQESSAIRVLDVDCLKDGRIEQPLTRKLMMTETQQKFKHFVQVMWHTGTRQYLYGATPAFASRLQGIIDRIHAARESGANWKKENESIGQLIISAIRSRSHLIEIRQDAADDLVGSVATAAFESFSAKRRANTRTERATIDDSKAGTPDKKETDAVVSTKAPFDAPPSMKDHALKRANARVKHSVSIVPKFTLEGFD